MLESQPLTSTLFFSDVLNEQRVTFTTRENTCCWTVVKHLNMGKIVNKEETFRSTEWGTDAALAMCGEVASLRVPGGNGRLTMQDIFNRTEDENISKVVLEEKIFSTWWEGRTVLIGDGEFWQTKNNMATCAYIRSCENRN